MIVFEYKCQSCLTIFDCTILNEEVPSCINCNSRYIKQNKELIYKPNKVFCIKNMEDKSFNKNWAKNLAPTLQYDIGECHNCTINQ